MKAIVTQAFDGVPDGDVHPRLIEKGETIYGSLAAVAVENGWATEEGKKTSAAAPKPTRSQAILQAAEGLSPKNPDHFTSDGRPQVKALEAVLGYGITAQERDKAWASRAKAS